MNIAPDHLTRIQSYGYSRTEAEFLYLVATHSGYFTQRQFLRFAEVEKGGVARRFTEKLLRFRHARTTRFGHRTLIYNLYSRLIYGSIDKDNLRNRRRLSNDLIRTRLLILDFVLDHLHHEYLETESHKVAFFHHRLHLELSILPGRIYKGIKSSSHTKRYFVDRFPIFIPCGPASLLLPLVPTFVYCDSDKPGLLRYIRHLRTYVTLLSQLSAFNFVYAAPNDAKFKRAAKFFASLFSNDARIDTDRLIRYFEIRQLWESHKTGSLTRADRQLLREGDRRFRGQIFQGMYQKWTATRLSRTDLNDAFQRTIAEERRLFSTCILPDSHDIFERVSKDHPVPEFGTISRNGGSKARSSPASPTVPPNSLEMH